MIEEIQNTLDHCVEYATDLLVETGEAYPFGAFIDSIGNVHPLEMEIDKKNVPTIGKVMEHLEKFCESEMREGNQKGYALAYEVQLQFEDRKTPTDAIAIDIRHQSSQDIPIYYLPFEKTEDSAVPGEVFAVKRS